VVQLFLAYAARKYKVSTIKATIDALAHWHTSKGASTLSVRNNRVTDLLKSISLQQGPSGVPQGKQGMSKPLLRLLLGFLAKEAATQPHMQDLYTRDAAWLVLGFFGMLRRSEIIALNTGSISFHKVPTPHLRVHIARSKTDQAGRGATILLQDTAAGGVEITTRVQRLLQLRKQMGAGPSDPLFTAWDLSAYKLSSTRLQNGQALAKCLTRHLSTLIERHPTLQLHPSSYGMHSLRRGGATAAWEGGVDKDRIMAHGRWTSSAVDAYLTATTTVKLSVTAAM
jgi:integrase